MVEPLFNNRSKAFPIILDFPGLFIVFFGPLSSLFLFLLKNLLAAIYSILNSTKNGRDASSIVSKTLLIGFKTDKSWSLCSLAHFAPCVILLPTVWSPLLNPAFISLPSIPKCFQPPTIAPIRGPAIKPIKPPTTAPIAVPTPGIIEPTIAPIPAPVKAPPAIPALAPEAVWALSFSLSFWSLESLGSASILASFSFIFFLCAMTPATVAPIPAINKAPPITKGLAIIGSILMKTLPRLPNIPLAGFISPFVIPFLSKLEAEVVNHLDKDWVTTIPIICIRVWGICR